MGEGQETVEQAAERLGLTMMRQWVSADAIETIQSLEAENAKLQERIWKRERAGLEIAEENVQLKAERDGLREDAEEFVRLLDSLVCGADPNMVRSEAADFFKRRDERSKESPC